MSELQQQPSAAPNPKQFADPTLSSHLAELDTNYNPNKRQNFLQELSEPRRQLDITSGTNVKGRAPDQTRALDEKREMQRKQLELQRQQIIVQQQQLQMQLDRLEENQKKHFQETQTKQALVGQENHENTNR